MENVLNIELETNSVRFPTPGTYALRVNTSWRRLSEEEKEVVDKMYERGDRRDIVNAIKQYGAFVIYQFDNDSRFTVCHITPAAQSPTAAVTFPIYTGVAKRATYAMHGDEPSLNGFRIAFSRALDAIPFHLPIWMKRLEGDGV